MTVRERWHDNSERGQWETVLGPFHAVARFNEQTGRYMAFLEDAATRGTNHYAPASFSDAEAAMVWCEKEAARLVAAGERLGRGDQDAAFKHQIASNLRDPGPEL